MIESLSTTSDRNAGLDGLRGVAAIAVLAFHSMHGPDRESWLLGGFFGVELFFVLSGYIITTLLIREEVSFGRLSLKQFYIRRALRLLPPLIPFLLFCWLESRYLESVAIHEAVSRGVISTLFYYSNWLLAFQPASLDMLNHTWSLSIEEQFYLTFPWLMVLFIGRKVPLKKRAAILCSMALLSVLTGALLVKWGLPVNRIVPRTDAGANQILWGCAAALLVNSGEESQRKLLQICKAMLVPSILVLIAVFLWCGVIFRSEHFIRYLAVTQLFAFAGAVVVISLAFNLVPPVTRLFSFRWLVYLGTISYALYLWHIPIFFYFDRHHAEWTWQVRGMVGWVVSIAAASLSWFLLESPLAKLRKKFHTEGARSCRESRIPVGREVSGNERL